MEIKVVIASLATVSRLHTTIDAQRISNMHTAEDNAASNVVSIELQCIGAGCSWLRMHRGAAVRLRSSNLTCMINSWQLPRLPADPCLGCVQLVSEGTDMATKMLSPRRWAAHCISQTCLPRLRRSSRTSCHSRPLDVPCIPIVVSGSNHKRWQHGRADHQPVPTICGA